MGNGFPFSGLGKMGERGMPMQGAVRRVLRRVVRRVVHIRTLEETVLLGQLTFPSPRRRYDLISGAYEQKELFGALRSYGGEQSRTFSHGELILPSNKSVEKEIREGVSGLHICDEWEKKIMKTQGRPNKMISFREAFTLHPSSNAYNGQTFKWEYDAIAKARAMGGGGGRGGGSGGSKGKSLIKSGLSGGHLFRKSTGEMVGGVEELRRGCRS